MRAVRLRTEYLENPIGIDAERPRLSWNCEGGKKQTAYRVVTDKWDSGRVESSSMHADYPLAVADRERVVWRVTLFDENGEEGEPAEAFFEYGVSSWDAGWITGGYKPNKNRRYPVDCFRRVFRADGDVARARLYITACGVYEARLGGEKIGSFYMAPGYTDYRRRVQYQTYDVGGMIRPGENELTVQLADGWYRGSCGAWGRRNQYGTETKLLAQLEIEYGDGRTEKIVTDPSWEWSDDGPVRFADNKDGETVEAFRAPSYSGRARATAHQVRPTASNNVPVAERERFKPTLVRTPSGGTVLDFGQNIAGYVSFSLDAGKGQRIRLRFGEMLDSDGEFTQKNFQLSRKGVSTPLQQVDYVCAEGKNEYATAFSVFGFRYAEVVMDVPFDPGDFTAVAVYSDLERTGWFESSSDLLNRFVEATVWSAKGNHLDIPTDCPTRERHGWTGDAQIFARTASYLFSFAPFARKFEHDLTDSQRKNGKFRQIAPPGGVDFYMKPMDGSAGWSDAGVLIPWVIFTQYGDERILADNYENMRRYALYKIRTVGKWYPTALPTGVGLAASRSISNYGQSYGEWAEPADVKAFSVSDFISPHPEETTAYVVYLLRHMAKIASVLGREDDAKTFSSRAEKVTDGYRRLVSTKKFSLDTDRQAKLVRPLFMDLLDGERAEFAKRRLISALDRYGWRLGTGFLSTPMILYVLADVDPEYAYRLLENEKIPGWLSMPKNGATTVWENWDGPFNTQGAGLGSLNHYSKGAVVEWLFSTACGIRVAGENSFLFAPIPGGTLTRASARYDSAWGTVTGGWERKDGATVYSFSVPPNCTAELVLPSGRRETLDPGEHTVIE